MYQDSADLQRHLDEIAVVAQLALIAYLIVDNHADLYLWNRRGSLRLARLVRLGLVEPTAPGAGRFTVATAARRRRMLRLHADLGVSLTGAAIIVDLLERLERLEAELTRRRGGP